MKKTLLLISLLIFATCSVFKTKPFRVGFSSLYNSDMLTLTVNDSLFYKEKEIKTNRTLGIDLKNGFSKKSKEINLKIKFYAIIDEDLKIERTVELDTLLFLKNGYNIIIFAGYDKIKIEQQKKIYILE